MSKERLEEMETKYSTITITSERDGIEYTEIDVKDLVFLIRNNFKQTERVKELEKESAEWEIETYIQKAGKRYLEQQNQRYRETLEFYANRDNYKLEHFDPNLDDYMSTVDYDEGAKARKALEGEE